MPPPPPPAPRAPPPARHAHAAALAAVHAVRNVPVLCAKFTALKWVFLISIAVVTAVVGFAQSMLVASLYKVRSSALQRARGRPGGGGAKTAVAARMLDRRGDAPCFLDT